MTIFMGETSLPCQACCEYGIGHRKRWRTMMVCSECFLLACLLVVQSRFVDMYFVVQIWVVRPALGWHDFRFEPVKILLWKHGCSRSAIGKPLLN
jgi:hypothetical protein